MSGFFVASLLVLVLVGGLYLSSSPEERRYLGYGVLAQVVATSGMLWFNSVTRGDMAFYTSEGVTIARFVVNAPSRWGPEVVQLLLQGTTTMPGLEGGQSSTGSMIALSAFLFLITGAEKTAPVTLVMGALGFVGRGLMFKVMRRELPLEDRRNAAIGCLLVPSTNFWSSGLVKETWAVFGLGLVFWGLQGLMRRRAWITGPLVVALGVSLAGLTKPYVLFPTMLGLGLYVVLLRNRGRFGIHHIVIGAAVAFAGIVAIGTVFPNYGLDRLGSSIAAQRQMFATNTGRSYVDLGADDVEIEDASLMGQLRFLPLAIVNTLFRPLLFDVRNFIQFVAALEATTLLTLVLVVFVRARLKAILRELFGAPEVLASGVFVIAFAAAVGLSTTNLGTLSRYRVPMMPLYVTAILVMRRRAVTAESRRPALARSQAPRPRPEWRSRGVAAMTPNLSVASLDRRTRLKR